MDHGHAADPNHPAVRLGISRQDDDPAMFGTSDAFVLPRLVDHWARCEPDRQFLVEVETGRTETYGTFRDLTYRWASVLLDSGVRRGDHVATMLPSSIDAHAVWIAAGVIGAVEVPIDPALRGEFLIHALTRADPEVCVVAEEHEPAVALTGLARQQIVRTTNDSSPADGATPAAIAELPTATDVSCVIFTSGTSGPAKGVVIPWGQMATTIGRIPRSWLSDRDAMYSPWPMFHVTGRSPLPMMADVGGRVVLRRRFSLGSFWSDIDEHRCTVASAAAVARLLLAEDPDARDRHHLLRHVFLGSGPTGLEFTERYGVNGIACYGSSEVGFPIANPSMSEADADSIGWLRPGYLTRVVGPTGDQAAPGEAGELLVRPSARSMIFTEYLGEPDRTRRAVVDGWYHTGDAVRQRPDGSLVFVDRIRDTIRRFGENISAKQVELAVMTDADVRDCAAFGIDDRLSGQEVLVCVVGTPGLDPARLDARLADVLPRHMRPAYIAVCDELPKSSNGKVRKQVLLEQLDLDRAWRASR